MRMGWDGFLNFRNSWLDVGVAIGVCDPSRRGEYILGIRLVRK